MPNFLTLFLPLLLASCAIGSKPCTDAGDLSWPEKFKGDKKCFQKKDTSGKYLNEGEYQHFASNGKLMLRGFFKAGKKNGMWIQYNDKGEAVVEKYYENGVEKSLPPLPGASDPKKP